MEKLLEGLEIPKLYEQDGLGANAKVYAKLFLPGSSWTWFVTEFDPATREAFGLVYSEFCPEGELGYFSLNELENTKTNLGLSVERDIDFEPTELCNCKNPVVS